MPKVLFLGVKSCVIKDLPNIWTIVLRCQELRSDILLIISHVLILFLWTRLHLLLHLMTNIHGRLHILRRLHVLHWSIVRWIASWSLRVLVQLRQTVASKVRSIVLVNWICVRLLHQTLVGQLRRHVNLLSTNYMYLLHHLINIFLTVFN